jgi:hypothetical protein
MASLIASSGRQDIQVDVLDMPDSVPTASDENVRAMARDLLHIVPRADMGNYQAVLAAQPISPLSQAVVAEIPSSFRQVNLERQYREASHLYPRVLQTTVYIRD